MGTEVKRRGYQSTVRAAQAAETRRRIIAAASRLFVERGYVRTTMADIAGAVGISSRAVHLIFANKRSVLDEAILVSLRGDDSGVRVEDREWFRRTIEAPADQIPEFFATFTTTLHVRTAALLQVAEAAGAADFELAVRRERGHENRRNDMRRVAASLARQTRVDVDYATDIFYALGSSATYSLLVFERGWSADRFETWLSAMLSCALLGRPATSAGPKHTFAGTAAGQSVDADPSPRDLRGGERTIRPLAE